MALALPDDATAGPELAAKYAAHLSPDEAYDAIAAVGLLNFANRAALATAIGTGDDLP